ncbi:MAG: integrin alpha [Planctomycetaceae bacterium]
MGDFNGDGADDIIIGSFRVSSDGKSQVGEAYVVFGSRTGSFPSIQSVGSLDGTNGFRIPGINEGDQFGRTLNGVGDVNGDGFDDVIIGSESADGAGRCYVIFGTPLPQTEQPPAVFDLLTLDATNGFRIDGINAESEIGDSINYSRSVGPAGDVNGDGFDDLLIGSYLADPGGRTSAGETYLIYGGNFTGGVETQVGDGAGNTLKANQGADAVDILIGGNGYDTLISDGG